MKVRTVPLERWFQDAEAIAAWHRVAQPCPQGHPFQDPAWIGALAGPTGRRVQGLAVYRCCPSGGLSPLLLLAQRPTPLFWNRWHRFLGDPLNDANTLCYEPGTPQEDLEAFVTEVLARLPAWDLMVLREVPTPSATLSALLAGARANGVTHDVRPSVEVPLIDTRSDWDTYWSTRSKRFRRTVAGLRNRWRRGSSVRRTLLGSGENADVEATLNLCSEIERRSAKPRRQWILQRGAGSARPPLLALARAGRLRCDVVEREGRGIAFLLSIVSGTTRFAFSMAYEHVEGREAPGVRLFHHLVTECIEAPDIERITLGRGGGHHKTRWANAREHRCHVRLFRNSLCGRLYHRLVRLRDWRSSAKLALWRK